MAWCGEEQAALAMAATAGRSGRKVGGWGGLEDGRDKMEAPRLKGED
jgi:hypothetical protein